LKTTQSRTALSLFKDSLPTNALEEDNTYIIIIWVSKIQIHEDDENCEEAEVLVKKEEKKEDT
jgi:hypothetical protein